MPSTYSTNLRFELIAPGEQTGTWGGTTNTNIGTLIEQAISGASAVVMADANLTMSANNGAVDQARSMYLAVTSSAPLTTTRNLVCPAVPKLYVVRNATTGGRSINVTAGGVGVLIPNGATVAVVCDGTDVRVAVDALPTYQPTFRNRIINGAFNIWQRGTSQTAFSYGSDDRWLNANVGSTKTASRQAFVVGQTDVPGEPTYFSRTVVASVAGAANYVLKQQRIEGVRTFAGQTVTLSFYAKADASRPIACEFVQFFGTGGAPSATVESIGDQQFSLTTSWQRFTATVAIPSISGLTLGTNGDDSLALTFWFDAGSSFNSRSASLGQQSGTFDIAQVQVEAGTSATSFEVLPPQVELALCQRYFYTTVGLGSLAFAVVRLMTSATYGGSQPVITRHPVPMFPSPSPVVVVYPSNSVARADPGNVLVNNTTLSTSFISYVDSISFGIYNDAALTVVGDYFNGFIDVTNEL